jgi:hypothetical protein
MVTGNRSRGEDFKRRILIHLHEHGYPSASLTGPTTLSERLRAPGDIDGLPVAMAVRTAQTIDFSSLLDEAENAADWSGRSFGVAIHSRRGREVGQCYAVVTLDNLVSLLHLMPSELAPPD